MKHEKNFMRGIVVRLALSLELWCENKGLICYNWLSPLGINLLSQLVVRFVILCSTCWCSFNNRELTWSVGFETYWFGHITPLQQLRYLRSWIIPITSFLIILLSSESRLSQATIGEQHTDDNIRLITRKCIETSILQVRASHMSQLTSLKKEHRRISRTALAFITKIRLGTHLMWMWIKLAYPSGSRSKVYWNVYTTS